MRPNAIAVVLRDLARSGRPSSNGGYARHLAQTMEWLRRAHDECNGTGVSGGYSLLDGWLAPYPETTGYLIPTFLRYAEYAGDAEFTSRALAMADWEVEVQMPSGGVQGGLYYGPLAERSEAVFNTGQVILGWCAAYRAFGRPEHLGAAARAGRWLCSVQSADGTWGTASPMTGTTIHAYDARTAWALLELAQVTGDDLFTRAACRHLDWVLSIQRPDGWFDFVSFYEPAHRWGVAFTHTIAYVMEGLLGAWRILEDGACLGAAQRTAGALLTAYRADEWLRGDFQPGWTSSAKYQCLTGSAQVAGVWLELGTLPGQHDFRQAGLQLLDDVLGTQTLEHNCSGVRGAVKGSHPIWGRYTPFVYPNWAAKFLADTTMCALGSGGQ